MLIFTRNWMEFQEVTEEELVLEQDLLAHIQEVKLDGDIVL